MSLKKYEAFVRTVELGSLTRAAEAMGSTQSRISHVLSTLEEEYGFVLLRRNRSGIRLTEAGAMVLPKMQEILQKDRELTELIGDFSTAMGLLLAMTGSECLLLLISTVCFLKGVG